MCRAPFDNGISSLEVTYDDDDSSEDNYENIPVTLINAACLGSEETAQLAFDRIVDLYNEAMVAASNSGHELIIRLLLDKGANAYNRAMSAASYNGQVHIVRLMLERGANNFKWQ